MGMKKIARLEENDFNWASGQFQDDYLFRGLRSVALESLKNKLIQRNLANPE